jgi:hypothetical protein
LNPVLIANAIFRRALPEGSACRMRSLKVIPEPSRG